jgi:hypothetical protein
VVISHSGWGWHYLLPIVKLLAGIASPLLQKLSIVTWRYRNSHGGGTLRKTLFNGNAPALVSLNIRDAIIKAQSFDLPKLKTLELVRPFTHGEGVRMRDLMVMLSNCPLLETLMLQVHVVDAATVDLSDITPIILARLKMISLHYFSAMDVPPTLSIISARNLSELAIYDTEGSLRHISAYFKASTEPFPHLQTLTLTHNWTRRCADYPEKLGDARSILQSFNSISSFRTLGTDWAPAFLNALAHDPNLCPTLAHIKCSDIGMGVVQNLVTRRDFAGVPIASLYFNSRVVEGHQVERDLEWFRDRVPAVGVLDDEEWHFPLKQ